MGGVAKLPLDVERALLYEIDTQYLFICVYIGAAQFVLFFFPGIAAQFQTQRHQSISRIVLFARYFAGGCIGRVDYRFVQLYLRHLQPNFYVVGLVAFSVFYFGTNGAFFPDFIQFMGHGFFDADLVGGIPFGKRNVLRGGAYRGRRTCMDAVARYDSHDDAHDFLQFNHGNHHVHADFHSRLCDHLGRTERGNKHVGVYDLSIRTIVLGNGYGKRDGMVPVCDHNGAHGSGVRNEQMGVLRRG